MDENEAVNAIITRPKKQKPAVHLADTVKPLNITIPKSAPREVGNTITALIYSDTHFPFHDPDVLAVVQAIAEDTQPDWLIHGGDLLDCRHLSRFSKNPDRKDSQQDEIDMAREHLATMRLAAPNSRFVYLEGNHEQRLQRTLWDSEGTAAVLTQLRVIKKALTWPVLLGLDELNIEFYPYGEQSKQKLLPKFITKHGNIVRQASGATAMAELRKYGKSGSSGHTHRLGVVWHRDSNGSHTWVETGCTCLLDAEYCVDPDWNQGCIHLTFDRDTGAVAVEPVFVYNGIGVFRGKTYGKPVLDQAA
jgi:predicted phosphodiesterase